VWQRVAGSHSQRTVANSRPRRFTAEYTVTDCGKNAASAAFSERQACKPHAAALAAMGCLRRPRQGARGDAILHSSYPCGCQPGAPAAGAARPAAGAVRQPGWRCRVVEDAQVCQY